MDTHSITSSTLRRRSQHATRDHPADMPWSTTPRRRADGRNGTRHTRCPMLCGSASAGPSRHRRRDLRSRKSTFPRLTDDHRRIHMTLRFAPPPKFPLYGMDSPGITHRALDWVHVYTRDRRSTTYGIWLVHLTSNGGTRIGSFDPATLAAMGDNPMVAVARHGTDALADLTLPTRDRTIAPIVARHVQAQTLPDRQWDESVWEIDGTSTLAETWSFANGWTGVVGVGHTYLCAVGTGPAPTRLNLRRLHKTTSYDFDHNAPIDRMHHRRDHRIWHESLLAPPNSDLHHDHYRLLDQQD